MTSEEILAFLESQLKEIRKQTDINIFFKLKITCPDCERIISMINLYRCFQCGLWICGKCAPEHFGIDKSKLPKVIK